MLTASLSSRARYWPLILGAVAATTLVAGCDRWGPGARQAREQVALEALRDSLWPVLSQLTGTAPTTPPLLVIVDRATASAIIATKMAEQLTAGALTDLETTYELFGLLPRNVHLIDVLRHTLQGEVLGLYDPTTKRMVMVRDGALLTTGGQPNAAARLVLAHELVHALQHHQVDLESLTHATGNLDAQLAMQAAIEGHAVWVSLRALFPDTDAGAIWPAVVLALQQAADTAPSFRDIPPFIRDNVLFPYREGTAYVARTAAARPPWPLPRPTSTQTLLREDRDLPHPVAGPSDTAGKIPLDAGSLRHNTMGVFGVLQLLQHDGRWRRDSTAMRAVRTDWRSDTWTLTTPPAGPHLRWESCWSRPTVPRLLAALFPSAPPPRVQGQTSACPIRWTVGLQRATTP